MPIQLLKSLVVLPKPYLSLQFHQRNFFLFRDRRMAAATKPEMNKSDHIRHYFVKNPEASGKEVVAAVAKKGITVTESHVSVVKTAATR